MQNDNPQTPKCMVTIAAPGAAPQALPVPHSKKDVAALAEEYHRLMAKGLPMLFRIPAQCDSGPREATALIVLPAPGMQLSVMEFDEFVWQQRQARQQQGGGLIAAPGQH